MFCVFQVLKKGMGSGPFFLLCGCCRRMVANGGLSILQKDTGEWFDICRDCDFPMPIPKPYSCMQCRERLMQKKRMRRQLRDVMSIVWTLHCVPVTDLLVLVRDYLVDAQCLVRMTLDHSNQQTPPKPIVLTLRKRRTLSRRRNTFIEVK